MAAGVGPSSGKAGAAAPSGAEGTVNKIKMLKRQLFGRANFDLLRIRVLNAY